MGIKKYILIPLVAGAFLLGAKYSGGVSEGIGKGLEHTGGYFSYVKKGWQEKMRGWKQKNPEEFGEEIEGFEEDFRKMLEEYKGEIKSGSFDEAIDEGKEKLEGMLAEMDKYRSGEVTAKEKKEELLTYVAKGLAELSIKVDKGGLDKKDFQEILDGLKKEREDYLSREEAIIEGLDSCRETKGQLNEKGVYALWQSIGQDVPKKEFLGGCLGEIGKFPTEYRQEGADYLITSVGESAPEKKKEMVFGLVEGLGIAEKAELVGKMKEYCGEKAGGEREGAGKEEKKEERSGSLFDKMNLDKFTKIF